MPQNQKPIVRLKQKRRRTKKLAEWRAKRQEKLVESSKS